jgi:hypothetical protein
MRLLLPTDSISVGASRVVEKEGKLGSFLAFSNPTYLPTSPDR